MRKVILEIATGLVIGVIAIEYDSEGGFSHWQTPVGCELRDDGPGAQPGAIWDGTQFIEPTPPPQTRLEILHMKLVTEDITTEEQLEMLRIERGLQDIYELRKTSNARVTILNAQSELTAQETTELDNLNRFLSSH